VYVSHLSLNNFRNYHHLELDIPPGLLTFSGGNAQGKTNLLEAVYLLSIAKAYRAGSDREAICRTAHDDQDHAQVIGIVQRGQDKVRIMVDMRLEGSVGERQPHLRKEISVNGIHVAASELVGVVNAVLFDAEDIQLVSGPPATRRRYLDILICQLDRSYLRALQRYQKVVYQRNHLLRLLRERRAQPRELDFWNEAIVQEGAYLTLRRHQVVWELRQLVTDLHCELTDAQEELSMDYVPSIPLIPLGNVDREDIQRSFETTLLEGLEKDVAMGSSQYGPHRDDLRLMVGEMEAANYASRGQARTLSISMKLAEGTLLERERGESPIILLDDVLSELDASRRRRLLEYVSRSQQAIVSTTDPDRVEGGILAKSSKFLVENGSIKPL
jgi:DNA replication and repair protein RecF